ncbi:hypothetical protein BS17DRAFT_399436 [Gyrodon lividus]|nr:hypothetical protein BS17DRAFT_399436 [Gyrodon lividus]
MDLFDDHSVPVVSQPTQLLQHALAPPLQGLEQNQDCSLASSDYIQDEGHASKEFSLDSMIVPPARNSVPRYRLHELPVIQNQSRNDSSEQDLTAAEVPQKENATRASSQENKRVESAAVTWPTQYSPCALLDNLPVKGSSSESFQHQHNSLSASGAGKVDVSRCKGCIFSIPKTYLHQHQFATSSTANKIHAHWKQVLPSFSLTAFPRFVWRLHLARSCRTVSRVNKTI